MVTCIHVYAEQRINGQWKAAAADTFNAEAPNRFGWINATMERVRVPERYSFYGLLLDGARYSWPWSFPQRGLPDDIAEETQQVLDSFGVEAYGHSHLSLRHLLEKYLELLLIGEAAQENRDDLSELIAELPKPDDPEDVRIVFWFDS